jgi:hypothetical protein
MAEVSSEVDDAQTIVGFEKPPGDVKGIVGRAIVDENDLIVRRECGSGAARARVKFLQVRGGPVKSCDNRQAHG